MTTLGTWLWTRLNGELVGTDRFGNRYFRKRSGRALVKGGGMPSRERRWVLYNGEPEASKVPAEWHGWLHHTVDTPPTPEEERRRYPWQKEHRPNMTGTPQAYHPRGSVLRGGERAASTSDYEAWKPE